MAKKPVDDFDNNDAAEQDWDTTTDDAADFGNEPHRRNRDQDADLHDDSDFVEDDMNDIVDETNPQDEDAHSDQEIEDYGDEEGDFAEAETEAPPKKSGAMGSIIFYGIIALVVAFGGYMGYKTLYPSSTTPRQQQAEQSTTDEMKIVVPTNANEPIPIPPTAPEGERAPTGWQTNLQQEPASQSTGVNPTAVPSTVDPQLLQSVATMNASMADMANKISQLTTELNTLTANTRQVAEVQQTQATQLSALESRPVATASGTAPARDPSVATDITALKAQVKALEARPVTSANGATVVKDPAVTGDLAALKAQVKALESRPAPTTGSSAAASPDVSSLRTQVSDLQKQLAQLKADMQKRPVASAAPASSWPNRKEPTKPAAKTMAKAEPQEEMEQPRSPKGRAAATPTSNSTWVLRAATPGMAWVSPRPGSAELQRVVVGDQLQGIGQIQSIRQEGGRWLVEGSSGMIR